MKKRLLSLALLAVAWLTSTPTFAWDEPTQVDGVYQIGTVSEMEWFSEKLNNKTIPNTSKATLTADLDYTGQSHTAIGPSAGTKFNGVFDGNGHCIKNLSMKDTNVGFFLWVRGGSTIKNLTMDKTCTFEADERAAAFVCVVQVAGAGSIEFENCNNYATVKAGSKVGAGFVAACNWENEDQPVVNFTNCVNAGKVTSTSDKAAAFFGWNKSASPCTLRNCINKGEISPIDGNFNLIRGNNAANMNVVNCQDWRNAFAGTSTNDRQGAMPAPSQDGDGYYQITSVPELEWYRTWINDNNLNAKAKLMNDIDFEGIENLHYPIGHTTGQKFNGIFDGQGHRIKNMIINRPNDDNIGFFGFLRGNADHTVIRNLIMDKSCSITARNRAGGFSGSCQNNGSSITIENCINEASVTISGQDAAGFVGGVDGGNPKWIIRNCINAGTITSTNEAPYVGALFCYQGNGESLIENFINLGTINGHRGGNMGRMSGTIRNIIDLSDTNMEGTTDGQNRGLDSGLGKGGIASGELAFYMNKEAGSNVFFQNLESNVDAYPVPFSTSAVVYQNGTLNCDGSPKETTYSNTNTGIIRDEHINVHDICSVCGTSNATINKDGEGFYQIANAAELAKFAQTVNAGEANAKGQLTADIDASADPYTVIGLSTVPFVGTIDGQGHSVTLGINNNKDYQGFVGYANGGAVIKNLVVKGSVQAGSHIGGIIGEANGSGTITITNVGNEANVSGQDEVAGIIGNNWGGTVGFNITNAYNIGDITIGGKDGATIATYMWNSTLTNVYNTGSVTGNINGQGNFVRANGCTYVNCYNTLDSDSENAGKKAIDASAVASGELCFKLGDAFRQNLTGSVDAYPVLDETHARVYANGTFKCDHETPVSIVYENTDLGTTYQDHVIKANGFCENCTLNPVESLSKDGEGYYLISNAAELEKFSDMVEVGGQSADNKAKLTADIDMTGVTHKPIGGGANDSNKFNSVFDGQNHTISHLTALTRNDNTGLFSWVRGSSTIKNLIIDETCEFSGTNHVAAFVGKTQAGDNVRFENCINKAHVVCAGNHAAAFVGKSEGPKTNMINCGNAGTIESDLNACAFVSWFRGGTIKFCWNIGEIVKGNWDRENGADYDQEVKVSTLNLFNGDAAYPTSIVSTFDASASAERSQGTLLDESAAASGELCYKLNTAQGKTVWYQTLGTETSPSPFGQDEVYKMTVGAADYATFVAPVDLVVPDGVEAYAAHVNGGYVALTAVDEVPTGEAVILKNTGDYYFNEAASATLGATNELQSSATDVTADGTQYILAKKNDVVGFYKATIGSTIKAGKAYIVSASSINALYFDDEETAISNVNEDANANETIYNLSGQRITKMQHGINIVNGNKVLK